jgi:uncharacterized RDD family membrane protein YckC
VLPASQEPVPADLAGSWTRVGARLLDYLFVHLGLLAVSAVLDLSLGFPDGGGYALTVLAVLVVYEIAFLYNRGQTLAKLLLGLRVIRADRAPLSLGDALKRSGIVGALGLVPFGLLASGTVMERDRLRQGLHDKAARTLVVSTGQRP